MARLPSINVPLDLVPDRNNPFTVRTFTESQLNKPTDHPQLYHAFAPSSFPHKFLINHALPIRLDPSADKLRQLDQIYNSTEHPPMMEPFPNQNADKKQLDEAYGLLSDHVNSRIPYVQLASQRLQAVIGVRDDRPFDLPQLRNQKGFPAIDHLYEVPRGLELRTGAAADAFLKARILSTNKKAELAGMLGGTDVFKNMSDLMSKGSEPSAMGPEVDKKTGAGLKNFLIGLGNQGLLRKRDCGSITFCDFTPDRKTGGHKNDLLGHWSATKERGEKIEVYEVDLPTKICDVETGLNHQGTETWIWIMISRPITSVEGTNLYEQYGVDDVPLEPHKAHDKNVPPNFRRPIPESWVVFACPHAHVSAYQETTEKDELKATSPSDINLSTSTEANTSDALMPPPKRIHKRADYDFSHFGSPIFEFYSPTFFQDEGHNLNVKFLSVDNMPTWNRGEPYERIPTAELKSLDDERYDEYGIKTEFTHRNEYGEYEVTKLLSPNHGEWWELFYANIGDEAGRWRKIKRAMARGMCRIVVRWDEIEGSQFVAGDNAAKVPIANLPQKMSRPGNQLLTNTTIPKSVLGQTGIANGGSGARKHKYAKTNDKRRSGLSEELKLGSAFGEDDKTNQPPKSSNSWFMSPDSSFGVSRSAQEHTSGMGGK